MGQIMGAGVTHYPPLLSNSDTYAGLVRLAAKSPWYPTR